MFKTKTHFCPRGASRPRPWSRGLHHWWRDPSAPNFGVPFWYCLLSQNYQILRGNTWGRGVYLGVSDASRHKRAEFQGYPILRVLLYLCLRPLTQNDQIRYGNKYGEDMYEVIHAIALAQMRRAVCQR